MSYSTSTPPRLSTQSITGRRVWELEGTDAASVVQVTGYITNGGDLGMKVGDLVRYLETDTNIYSNFTVATVSSTAPGAVDLTDATTSATGTNSN